MKLHLAVKKLEDDFDYQYKYNTELIQKQKELREEVARLQNTVLGLHEKLQPTLDKCWLWYTIAMSSSILLVSTATIFLKYCPHGQKILEVFNVRF